MELLPPGTAQRTTIEGEMKRLGAMIDGRAPRPAAKDGQARKKAGALAGTGAVAAALLKFKALAGIVLANAKLLAVGLLKLPTLLSMLVFSQFHDAMGFDLAFGLGFIACIYVHEVGHIAALRRYGIDASAPMFIPGFGALVRMRQYPTDAHEEARTGLAGPLWGLGASIGALLLGAALGGKGVLLLASWSASINVFNLLPVWQLDGARGLKALSRLQRTVVGATALAVGLVAGQWMPGLVGVVVLGRAWVGEAHPVGDRRMLALFASLVVALPAVVWVADTLHDRL